MAQYLIEILGDKLDLSNIKADETGRLPSPEKLKGKILVKVTSESGCLRRDLFSLVRGVSPEAIVSAQSFINWSLNLKVHISKAGGIRHE